MKSNMLSLEGKTPRKIIPFLLKTPISKLIIVIIMENKNLQWLLSRIAEDQDFHSELITIEQVFLVKIYNITELNSAVVEELFNTVQKKFYLNRKTTNEEYWYQNQLRIFVWVLFAYLHVTHKDIASLVCFLKIQNQDDWQYFSSVFNFKSKIFFQFQAKSLIKPQGKPATWEQQQTQLLETIIKEKNFKNRWNSIARELFVRSGKKYFRNPKKCRERWMNHLDPSKIHTQWSISEDLILLNCIKKKGKRWSIAVKQLSNKRTEHMVKNRYNSLVSNETRKYPGKSQAGIEALLIRRLTKVQEKSIKQSQTEQLLTKDHSLVKISKRENLQNLGEEEALLLKQQNSNEFKQQFKIQVDLQGNSCYEKLNVQLNEFQANSPMFIPWNLQRCDHQFTKEGKLKMQEHFYSHDLQIQDSQQL